MNMNEVLPIATSKPLPSNLHLRLTSTEQSKVNINSIDSDSIQMISILNNSRVCAWPITLLNIINIMVLFRNFFLNLFRQMTIVDTTATTTDSNSSNDTFQSFAPTSAHYAHGVPASSAVPPSISTPRRTLRKLELNNTVKANRNVTTGNSDLSASTTLSTNIPLSGRRLIFPTNITTTGNVTTDFNATNNVTVPKTAAPTITSTTTAAAATVAPRNIYWPNDLNKHKQVCLFDKHEMACELLASTTLPTKIPLSGRRLIFPTNIATTGNVTTDFNVTNNVTVPKTVAPTSTSTTPAAAVTVAPRNIYWPNDLNKHKQVCLFDKHEMACELLASTTLPTKIPLSGRRLIFPTNIATTGNVTTDFNVTVPKTAAPTSTSTTPAAAVTVAPTSIVRLSKYTVYPVIDLHALEAMLQYDYLSASDVALEQKNVNATSIAEQFDVPKATDVYAPTTAKVLAAKFVVPKNATNFYTPATAESVTEQFVLPNATNIFVPADDDKFNAELDIVIRMLEKMHLNEKRSVTNVVGTSEFAELTRMLEKMHLNETNVLGTSEFVELNIVTRKVAKRHLNEESVTNVVGTSEFAELNIVTRKIAKRHLNEESVTDVELSQMCAGLATSEYVVPTSPMDVDADVFMPMDVDKSTENSDTDVDMNVIDLDPITQVVNDADSLDWEPIVSEIAPRKPVEDASRNPTESNTDVDMNVIDLDPITQVVNDADYLDWEPTVSENAPRKPVDDASRNPTESMSMFSPFQLQSVYRLA